MQLQEVIREKEVKYYMWCLVGLSLPGMKLALHKAPFITSFMEGSVQGSGWRVLVTAYQPIYWLQYAEAAYILKYMRSKHAFNLTYTIKPVKYTNFTT